MQGCYAIGWAQILALILGNAALVIPLWLWNRTESRADTRHMDERLEAYRLDTKNMIQGFQQETKGMIQAIQQEIKDFHGRLCAIEERTREKK